ncbi:MAG: hypothetical protein V2J02_02660 [Pseudomonadales bacterium]|jgi:hypothetical protein|nr:hypothetical protein [Pseudomonadales bacterium]
MSTTTSRPLRLTVPARNQRTPAFCDGTREGLEAWLGGLPMTDVRRAGRALHGALVELNRTSLQPAHRFAQLETLRPVVHYACSGLTRSALARTNLLDEDERRMVTLAQSLQHQLATGYRLVLVDGMRAGERLSPHTVDTLAGRRLVTALHRALSDSSAILLRALQLYAGTPTRLWEELHQLYLLARARGVLEVEVTDPEHRVRPDTAVGDAYLRALLLACARPNNLRPAALGTLYQALEDWARLARLVPLEDLDDPLHVVDLAGNGAPKALRLHRFHDDEDLRSVDASELVAALAELDPVQRRAPARADAAALPAGVDADLLRHLIHAWGEAVERSHERRAAAGRVELCLGLEAIHFFAGDALPLEEQLRDPRLRGREREPSGTLDPFAGAPDGGSSGAVETRTSATDEPAAPLQVSPEIAQVRLTDVSAFGFGLAWEGGAPARLRTGELVGIRQGRDQHWTLAMVRWLHAGDGEVRLGVEVLAARCVAVCARVLSTRGAGWEWTPALLLPAQDALDEPATLVAPRSPFRAGQKLALNQAGSESKIRLETGEMLSEEYDRFTFRELGLTTVTSEPTTGIEVELINADEYWESVEYHFDGQAAS